MEATCIMHHMRDPKPYYVVRLGIFAVVVGAICTLVPSALGQTKPEVLPAGASANVWLAGGQAIVEATQPEQTVPSAPLPATPWGTPVLVSPRNGTPLYHYPRTTTLIWQPVLTATAYVVEAAYLSGSTWTAYPPVTVTGNSNAFYTFTFVGDQKGRWRVLHSMERSTHPPARGGRSRTTPRLRWRHRFRPILRTTKSSATTRGPPRCPGRWSLRRRATTWRLRTAIPRGLRA
jgi:hypothetical protein